MNGSHTAHAPRWGRLLLAPVIAIGLAACGGGGGTPTPTPTPTAAYTVGGTISGLNAGATVQLLDNGGDALSVSANGNFQFATAIQQGGSYAVTVGTQPAGETCSVANATGSSISANVTNVTVTCSPITYTIGGTITGLATGQQVTLVDNGTDSLVVTANGNFQFLGQIAQGGSYQVTIGTQPGGQVCALANASGSNVTANVSTVTLTCRTMYAYVGNIVNPGTIEMYALGGDGSLSALSSSPLAPPQPNLTGAAVTPNGAYAYFVSQNGYVLEYSVNGSAGLKALSTPSIAAGTTPTDGIIDPTGSFLYVTNQVTNNSTVTAFSISPTTGQLTPIGNIPAGSDPLKLAMGPGGKYLYVTNTGGTNAQMYSINATTGLLTNLGTVSTGNTPRDIVVTPSGAYAYVANNGSNSISSYTVNATTGVLAIKNLSAETLPTPWGLAIDPTGKYLYALSTATTGAVYQYIINSDGTLTAMTNPSISTGSNAAYLTVDPTGRYLYVSASGSGTTVSQYSIDSTSGQLSPLTQSTVSSGTSPGPIVVY